MKPHNNDAKMQHNVNNTTKNTQYDDSHNDDTAKQQIARDRGEDVEGAMATPTEGMKVSVQERHNDFKDEKRV